MEEQVTEEPKQDEQVAPVDPGEQQGEVESVASGMGWKSDGELSASEFLLETKNVHKKMRSKIDNQKFQLDGLGAAVKELKIHNDKVYKAEVKQLKSELSDLKSKKKEAIEEGDVEAVEKLDGEIDGVKEAMSTPAKEERTDPEFDSWVKDNKWYLDDAEMAAYANKIADDNAGAPFKRVTDLIGRRVKDMFPDKFDKSQPAPSPVEGAGRKIATSKFTASDLTSSQKSIGKEFERQGIMTMKAYIADIAKTQ